MREKMLAQGRRVGSAFGAFTPGQKAVTILGVLVLAIGGYFFSTWAAQPTYAPLFSNLAPADASAIVDKLAAAGTPYKLSDGGATIEVPQAQVYDMRVKMAGQGLPAQTDAGYSLLDKQGITTSEFMQNVGYQRALEGELAKTISSISGVRAASVHLAIPTKDVFADDQRKPTASVLITTGTGGQLSGGQVRAIVHLVASSVVGLDPGLVTVADATGAVLSTGDGQGAGTDTAARDQQTGQFESRMSTALEQMLASVVGPGHVVVRTTAELNYDQTQTRTQTYVAPSPSTPPLSQTTTSEQYANTGTGAAGILGATALPTAAASPGTYAQWSNTQDNAFGTVTQTVNSAPGNVRRLSVAVLLDATVAGTVDLKQIQSLVASAAALTPSRGDTITVSAMPFDQSLAKQAAAATAQANKAAAQQGLLSMVRQGVLVVAVLVVLFLAWRAARRAKRTALTEDEMAQLERIQASIESSTAAALPGAATEAPALESAPTALSDDEHAQRRQEITSMVERRPDEVAALLRNWLGDRRT